MRIAMLTSVSAGCAAWANITTPNHAAYCQQRGYTFIARHLPYSEALADFAFLTSLLDYFDVVWCLDADAVITNMSRRVEDLDLQDGLNVCLEGLRPDVLFNCGSTLWKNSSTVRKIIDELVEHEPAWRRLQFVWQQWLCDRIHDDWWKNAVKVHPARTFNSCHHGRNCLWEPGDFVYHPCGHVTDARAAMVRAVLAQVQS
jgi:hypothetical protein